MKQMFQENTYLVRIERTDGIFVWHQFNHTYLYPYEFSPHAKDVIRVVNVKGKKFGFWVKREGRTYNYDVSVSKDDLLMYMLQVEVVKESIYD